ncbi:hypothetical protein T07_5819 [Trichinella nelsoni]|uniref:Uncharacterized protein n=1 Tax=Trichinella nelsoni TaxID=6336 RepID=A0A0V0RJH1_9BILA|nr:hypothetical protein T07_5819 [Trichinella nelsoni]
MTLCSNIAHVEQQLVSATGKTKSRTEIYLYPQRKYSHSAGACFNKPLTNGTYTRSGWQLLQYIENGVQLN